MRKRFFRLMTLGLIGASVIGFVSCEKENVKLNDVQNSATTKSVENEYLRLTAESQNGNQLCCLEQTQLLNEKQEYLVFNGNRKNQELHSGGIGYGFSKYLEGMIKVEENDDYVAFINEDKEAFVKALRLENCYGGGNKSVFNMIMETEVGDMFTHAIIESNYINFNHFKEIKILTRNCPSQINYHSATANYVVSVLSDLHFDTHCLNYDILEGKENLSCNPHNINCKYVINWSDCDYRCDCSSE